MKQRNFRSARASPAATTRPAGWLAAAAVAALLAVPAYAQSGPAGTPPAAAPAMQPGPAPAAPPPQSQPQAQTQPQPQSQPQAQTQPQPSGPQAAPAAGLVLPPQPPPPALPGAPPTNASNAPPATQRGFLNGFGAWWDKSIADWKAKMKEQQTKIDAMNKQSADAAKDAATAAQQALKSAADAMLPSHVVEIKQTCPVAGNGAADCETAAMTVCKSKGYSSGQPLDVRTAEKCSDSLWVSGQTPTAADCPVETTLLRAACR